MHRKWANIVTDEKMTQNRRQKSKEKKNRKRRREIKERPNRKFPSLNLVFTFIDAFYENLGNAAGGGGTTKPVEVCKRSATKKSLATSEPPSPSYLVATDEAVRNNFRNGIHQTLDFVNNQIDFGEGRRLAHSRIFDRELELLHMRRHA